MLFQGCFLSHFNQKNGSLSEDFKAFPIYSLKKCVKLHRRAFVVPSQRMRGWVRYYILHNNVKASSMLCLLVVWNFHIQSQVKDNVRSECYGYAIYYCIPGCAWGYIISSRHTFSEVRVTYQRRQSLYESPARLWKAPNDRRVELEAYAFCIIIIGDILLNYFALLGF